MDLGQGRRGVDMGPSSVRYAGIAESLRGLEWIVKDDGNLTVPEPEEHQSTGYLSGLDHLDSVAAVNRDLSDRVEDSLSQGEFAIVLGGDHSIAAAIVQGLRDRPHDTRRRPVLRGGRTGR